MLPPEHIFQKAGSDNCGPCCLEMIYTLKGKNKKLTDILSDLKYPPNGKNTFPGQLATHLLQNGVNCRMYIANSRVVSPAWRDLSRDALISNIDEWIAANPKDDWIQFGKSLLEFIKNSGTTIYDSLDANDLSKMLSKNSYLIACVEGPLLWGHKFIMKNQKIDEIHGPSAGHYVLVKSQENNLAEILDPYPTKLPERDGHYLVSLKDLINATLVWSGTVIEVLN